MNPKCFESILHKVSILAIHCLSGNTRDSISVMESIEHHIRYRPTLGCVQAMGEGSSTTGGYYNIVFCFSPEFMLNNKDMTSQAGLQNIQWTFCIPNYRYGQSHGNNKAVDDEEVSAWLQRSAVEVRYQGADVKDLEYSDLVDAIKKIFGY